VFPWRTNPTPYRVLVSEIMLQQTQAERVAQKYREFLTAFPSVRSLARAPQGRVLRAWQGLGYNRRALMLRRSAQAVVSRFNGRIPGTIEELRGLPGVGPYTAAAVLVFAWNRPATVLETNIRSVFIHHFFPRRRGISDTELIPLIEATQDTHAPRRWYSALMDYGSVLKRAEANPSRRSIHHASQPRFRGSRRELRGAILALAARKRSVVPSDVRAVLLRSAKEIAACFADLVREGFLVRSGSRFRLK
jgi:A/G-specific adenine glycosylase